MSVDKNFSDHQLQCIAYQQLCDEGLIASNEEIKEQAQLFDQEYPSISTWIKEVGVLKQERWEEDFQTANREGMVAVAGMSVTLLVGVFNPVAWVGAGVCTLLLGVSMYIRK